MQPHGGGAISTIGGAGNKLNSTKIAGIRSGSEPAPLARPVGTTSGRAQDHLAPISGHKDGNGIPHDHHDVVELLAVTSGLAPADAPLAGAPSMTWREPSPDGWMRTGWPCGHGGHA
jgi:hypothetical protein